MTNAFLPFATAGGANVATAADYSANSNYASGYQAGAATSKFLNYTWRQSSFVAATIGQFISDNGANAVDDGIIANLETALATALVNFIKNASFFSSSKAVSGYQKLPGGLIIQWVQAAITSGTVVSLPISFPNQLLTVLMNVANGAAWSGATTINAVQVLHNASGQQSTITWAIGY